MKHKCTFCTYQTDDIVACGQHYEAAHKNLIPAGMSGEHFAYYIYSGRKEGRCVVCHRPTKFNKETHKYFRICSARCKKRYGEIKKLNDPKVQENMLQHRKISGEYTWSTADDSGNRPKFNYTGTYELDFVKYMDTVKHWSPNDLMMPCPMTFEYKYDGRNRFYIPDAYIPSIDLIIEIKDGDPNNPNHHANMHPDIQRVNRQKEKLKKEAVSKSTHNYITIYNKDYRNFELYLRTSKKQYLTEDIESMVNTVVDIISNDVKSRLMDAIDAWREYVKENSLERYCKISSKINDLVYEYIDSDKFDDAIHSGKTKTFIDGILTASDDKVKMTLSVMDDDSAIKSEFGDPYIIYTKGYLDALDKLEKMLKHPMKYLFFGKNVDIERDKEDDRRLLIDFTIE